MLQAIVRISQIAFFVLGAAAIAWFLSDKIRFERQRDLPPFQQALAVRAVERIVADLPRRDAIKRLLVMPASGQDLDDRVTDLLLDRIEVREEYDIVDARGFEGAKPPANVEEAIRFARKVRERREVDGILVSTVRRETGHGGLGAAVEIESRLVALDKQAQTPTEVVRAAERIASRASLDWWSAYMRQQSSLARLLIWVLVAAGLPFAIFKPIQAIVRRENNRWNAALVGGLTGVDVLLAAALLGLRLGFFGWVLVAVAGFGGFVYNFTVCDRIDEMRK